MSDKESGKDRGGKSKRKSAVPPLSGIVSQSDMPHDATEGDKVAQDSERMALNLAMEPKKGFAPLGISKLSLSSAVAKRDQEFGGRASLPRMESLENEDMPTGFFSARGPREFKLSLGDNIRPSAGHAPSADSSNTHGGHNMRTRQGRAESVDHGNPRSKVSSLPRNTQRTPTNLPSTKPRPVASGTKSHPKGERKVPHITPIPSSLGSPRHSPRNTSHSASSTSTPSNTHFTPNPESVGSPRSHQGGNPSNPISIRKPGPLSLPSLSTTSNLDPESHSTGALPNSQSPNTGIEIPLSHLSIAIHGSPRRPITTHSPRHNNGVPIIVVEDPVNQTGPNRTPSPIPALLPGGSPRIVTDSVLDDLVDSPTSPPLSRRSFVIEEDDGIIMSPKSGFDWGLLPSRTRYLGRNGPSSSEDEAEGSHSDSSSVSGDSRSTASSSAESTDSTTSSSSCSNSTDSTSDNEVGHDDGESGAKKVCPSKRPSVGLPISHYSPLTPSHMSLDAKGTHSSSDSDEDAAELHALSFSHHEVNHDGSHVQKPRYPYKQGHPSSSGEFTAPNIAKPKAVSGGKQILAPGASSSVAAPSSTGKPSPNEPISAVEAQRRGLDAHVRHSSPSEHEPSPLANSHSPYIPKRGGNKGKDHGGRRMGEDEPGSSGSDSEGDHISNGDDAAYDAPNEGSPRSEAEMRALQQIHRRSNISSPTQGLQSPRNTSGHFSPRFTATHPPSATQDASSHPKRTNRSFTTYMAPSSSKLKARSRGHSFPLASPSGNLLDAPDSQEQVNGQGGHQNSNEGRKEAQTTENKDFQNGSASESFTGSTNTSHSSTMDANANPEVSQQVYARDSAHLRPRARSFESMASTGVLPHSFQSSQSFGGVSGAESGSTRTQMAGYRESDDQDLYDQFQQKNGYEYDQDQSEESDEDTMYDDDEDDDEMEDDENDYDLDDDEEGEDDFDDDFDALSISPGSSAMMVPDGGHGEDLYHPIDFETVSLEELIREHNRNPDLLYMIEVADPTLMAWLCSEKVVTKMVFALSDQFGYLQLEDTGTSGRNYEKEILSSFTYYLITSPNGSVPNFLLENFQLLDLFFVLSYAPGFRASPDWTRVMLFLLSRGASAHLITQYMSSELPNFQTTFSSFIETWSPDTQNNIQSAIGVEGTSRGEFALNALLRLIGNDNVARLLAVLILPEESTVPWIDIMSTAKFTTLIGNRLEALHNLPHTEFSKHQTEAANLTEFCGLIISKTGESLLSLQLQSETIATQLVRMVCKKQPHPVASFCLSIMCHMFDLSYNNREYESSEFTPIIKALLNEQFEASEENVPSGYSEASPSTAIGITDHSPSLPLEYLAYQLETPTLQAIQANQLLNPARQPFGLYRLHLLKSVNSLLKTNYGILHREMFKTGLVTSVMNAMFRHATGSLIHLNVADTIGNVMYFERTEWLLEWLVKFEFIEKVASGFEAAASHLIPPMSPIRLSASSSAASIPSTKGSSETDAKNETEDNSTLSALVVRATKPKSTGYCQQPEYAPHLVSICIKLDRLASSVAPLQEYLNAQSRWDYLFTTFVEPLSKQYRELSDVASLRRTNANSLIAY